MKKKSFINKLMSGAFALMTVVSMTSCQGFVNAVMGYEDNSSSGTTTPTTTPTTPTQDQYIFTIQNAVYVDDNFPQATTTDVIEGLQINLQAIRGGQNMITVTTQQQYNRFFVGLQDQRGYWSLIPVGIGEAIGENVARRTESGYLIPIMYTMLFTQDITMLIAAEDANGNITTPLVVTIHFINTNTDVSDLNVSLTFQNEKDVDLHMYTPSGRHIYYGDKGGEVTLTDGRVISFGLDLDSNPACNIDGIKNENIYIPKELVETGTYIIKVDMYSNCDPSISTDWAVVARYNNNLLTNEIGSNPAFGTYPVNAPDGDYTTVMQFTINGAAGTRGVETAVDWSTFKPYPISEIARFKIENTIW
jgi:hypothetical protein